MAFLTVKSLGMIKLKTQKPLVVQKSLETLIFSLFLSECQASNSVTLANSMRHSIFFRFFSDAQAA
ncbi:MAG: hypothetical protein AAF327_23695, partial [Cyanobacteria bacterium P01_A01_bin.37]